MKDRLHQFLTAEQLSPGHFADSLGVQRSGVSHILSGRNKPGFDFIEKFLTHFPTVNAEWLITGRGKMYKEMNTPALFNVETTPVISPVDSEKNAPSTSNEPTLPFENRQAEYPENTGGKAIPTTKKDVKVERVIIFYDNHLFADYRPGEDI